MFEAMRQTLAQRITSASKFDESTRNFLLPKVCALELKQISVVNLNVTEFLLGLIMLQIRLVTIEVGTPFQNNTLLKDLYLSVDMQKQELFANVETLIDFQSRGLPKDLAQPNKIISSSSTILNAMASNPFTIQFILSNEKCLDICTSVLYYKI